jgi:hypothetical protein
MIQRVPAEGIRVTFTLESDEPVSVVGDFNDWDPDAHPLVPAGKGRRSASVLLEPGTEVAFRYLADGGRFFDDPDADRYEDNGRGETHGVLVLPATAKKAAAKKAPAKKAPVKKPPIKKPPVKKPPIKKAVAKRVPAAE